MRLRSAAEYDGFEYAALPVEPRGQYHLLEPYPGALIVRASRDAKEIRIHETYRAVDGIPRDRDRGRSGSLLVGSPARANLEQNHSATAGSDPQRGQGAVRQQACRFV